MGGTMRVCRLNEAEFIACMELGVRVGAILHSICRN